MKIAKLKSPLIAAAALLGALSTAQAQNVKIGVIAPLTGPGAAFGIPMEQGAKLAAADVNARGGITIGGKKHMIEVIAYDDQYKAAEAVAAYSRLVSRDGAKYVMTLSSASALAVKESMEADKIVSVSGAYTSKLIDDKTTHIFRAFSTAQNYMPSFGQWLKDNLSARRVAILNPNDETGWDQAQLAEKTFKQAGLTVVANETYERTQKDFQPLLTKLMTLNPELIDFNSSPPATAGLIIRQARELGYKGQFLKSNPSGPREVIEAAGGKEFVEDMICILFADPNSKSDYQRIAAAYKKTVGQEANEDSRALLRRRQRADSRDRKIRRRRQYRQGRGGIRSGRADEVDPGRRSNHGSSADPDNPLCGPCQKRRADCGR